MFYSFESKYSTSAVPPAIREVDKSELLISKVLRNFLMATSLTSWLELAFKESAKFCPMRIPSIVSTVSVLALDAIKDL